MDTEAPKIFINKLDLVTLSLHAWSGQLFILVSISEDQIQRVCDYLHQSRPSFPQGLGG